jgi:hypothetical protein
MAVIREWQAQPQERFQNLPFVRGKLECVLINFFSCSGHANILTPTSSRKSSCIWCVLPVLIVPDAKNKPGTFLDVLLEPLQHPPPPILGRFTVIQSSPVVSLKTMVRPGVDNNLRRVVRGFEILSHLLDRL